MASRVFRCEFEVLEAVNLPSSARGCRPDPMVRLTFFPMGLVYRTKLVPSNANPAFAERFHIECPVAPAGSTTAAAPGMLTSHGTVTVAMEIFDKEESPAFLVAKNTLDIGGAARLVGARWIPLATIKGNTSSNVSIEPPPATPTLSTPQVRVLWHCEELVSDAAATAAIAEDTTEAARFQAEVLRTQPEGSSTTLPTTHVATTPATTGSASDHGGQFAGGLSNAHQAAALTDVLRRLGTLEESVAVLTHAVGSRLVSLEQRLIDLESTAFARRQAFGATSAASGARSGGGLRLGAVNTAAADLLLPPSSTLAPGVDKKPDNVAAGSNTAASTAMKVMPKGMTALESIVANPTVLTAKDEQTLAGYGYHNTVNLPTVPHSRAVPVATAASNLSSRHAASPNTKYATAMAGLAIDARKAVEGAAAVAH